MVAASVGAPRDPKMDFLELIERFKKNTAAQEEQTKKMERQRQELGVAPLIIQQREPTYLELLLEKWEWPSREPEGVELPSREPEGVELPSREPEGVELPSREPEGVELPSREPEGVELPSREPEGVELPSREPEVVELPSREPERVELLLPEPRGEEPPLPEPSSMQASPALQREVPSPVIVDTWPECPDLPALDLAPRSQHCQAQSLAWSLTPLPLESQMSLRKRQMSLRKGQRSLAFPLLIASLPLHRATLHLEFQRSLRRSTGACLCLSVLAPGHRSALWSPWTSHLGPSSPVLGPSLETPEGPTHPQARPWKRAKIDICGLEGGGGDRGSSCSSPSGGGGGRGSSCSSPSGCEGGRGSSPSGCEGSNGSSPSGSEGGSGSSPSGCSGETRKHAPSAGGSDGGGSSSHDPSAGGGDGGGTSRYSSSAGRGGSYPPTEVEAEPAGTLPLLAEVGATHSPPTEVEVEPAGTLPLLAEVGSTHSPPTEVEVEPAGTLPLLVETPPLGCGRTDSPLLGCGCTDSHNSGAGRSGSSHSDAGRSGSSHSRSMSPLCLLLLTFFPLACRGDGVCCSSSQNQPNAQDTLPIE
ncbi:UNVERIFIED_CONTAM: hypothetical protein FKN15_006337 [Acipenser sinensis]